MSLYDQLGGGDAIAAALNRFYEKVLADDRVSVFFDGVNLDRVKAQQQAFIAMALGGPKEYGGRDLRTAHRRARTRGLDDERFDIFAEYFRETMVELGVEAQPVEQVMEIVYGGKEEVLAR